jgi:hypothetical protein
LLFQYVHLKIHHEEIDFPLSKKGVPVTVAFFDHRPDISRMTSKRDISGLAKAMLHDDPEIAANATWALAGLGPQALEPLLSALANKNATVRRNTAEALAVWGFVNPPTALPGRQPKWIARDPRGRETGEVEFFDFVGRISWCKDNDVIRTFFSTTNKFVLSVLLEASAINSPDIFEKILPYWELHGEAAIVGIISQLTDPYSLCVGREEYFVKVLSGSLTASPDLHRQAIDGLCDVLEKDVRILGAATNALAALVTAEDQHAVAVLKEVVTRCPQERDAVRALARLGEHGFLFSILNRNIDEPDLAEASYFITKTLEESRWHPSNQREKAIHLLLTYNMRALGSLGRDGLVVLTRRLKAFERQERPINEDMEAIVRILLKLLVECTEIDEGTLQMLANLRVWQGTGTSFKMSQYELESPELIQLRDLAKSRLPS